MYYLCGNSGHTDHPIPVYVDQSFLFELNLQNFNHIKVSDNLSYLQWSGQSFPVLHGQCLRDPHAELDKKNQSI
jgi:hypothetical protein